MIANKNLIHVYIYVGLVEVRKQCYILVNYNENSTFVYMCARAFTCL